MVPTAANLFNSLNSLVSWRRFSVSGEVPIVLNNRDWMWARSSIFVFSSRRASLKDTKSLSNESR